MGELVSPKRVCFRTTSISEVNAKLSQTNTRLPAVKPMGKPLVGAVTQTDRERHAAIDVSTQIERAEETVVVLRECERLPFDREAGRYWAT